MSEPWEQFGKSAEPSDAASTPSTVAKPKPWESFNPPALTRNLSTPAAAPSIVRPTPPERTWGEAAEDTGRGLMSGFAGLGKAAGDLYGIATGDTNNALSRAGARAQEYWQEGQSESLKLKRQLRSEAIDKADGVLGKAGTAIAETVTDPALLVDLAAENIPSLVPGLGAGRVAGVATKANALRRGLNAGEAAVKAGKVGTAAAVGVGAVQQGVDVAQGAYDSAFNQPDEVWNANPDYRMLVDDGISPEAAKHQLALSAARATLPAATAASVLTQLVPGGRKIEEVLGGATRTGGRLVNAAVGAGGEAVQEGLEEGSGAFISNVAQQQFTDPNRDLTEGVGESAGLGAVGGTVIGGPLGLLQRPAPPKIEGGPRGDTPAPDGGDITAQVRAGSEQALRQTLADPNATAEQKAAAQADLQALMESEGRMIGRDPHIVAPDGTVTTPGQQPRKDQPAPLSRPGIGLTPDVQKAQKEHPAYAAPTLERPLYPDAKPGSLSDAVNAVATPQAPELVDPVTGATSPLPDPAAGPLSRAVVDAAANGAVPTTTAPVKVKNRDEVLDVDPTTGEVLSATPTPEKLTRDAVAQATQPKEPSNGNDVGEGAAPAAPAGTGEPAGRPAATSNDAQRDDAVRDPAAVAGSVERTDVPGAAPTTDTQPALIEIAGESTTDNSRIDDDGYEFIRAITDGERKNGQQKRDVMKRLQEQNPGRDVVYKPAGANGAGYYLTPNQADAGTTPSTESAAPQGLSDQEPDAGPTPTPQAQTEAPEQPQSQPAATPSDIPTVQFESVADGEVESSSPANDTTVDQSPDVLADDGIDTATTAFRAAAEKAGHQISEEGAARMTRDIANAVQEKNAKLLVGMNLGDAKANPSLRAAFESLSGVKLPKGRKASESAIYEWAGTTYEQAQNEKAQRRAEAEEAKRAPVETFPEFRDYNEANQFMRKRAELFGGVKKYAATEEYQRLHPIMAKLAEQHNAKVSEAATAEAENAGVKAGTPVTMVGTGFLGPSGQTVHGTVFMKQGIPWVRIDNGDTIAVLGKKGKVSNRRAVRWSPDWQAKQDAASTVQSAAAEAATSPANNLPEPTEAQKEAGNFKVGRMKVAGLDVSIEHPAGVKRKAEHSQALTRAYGYIRRTEGADGEKVDVFLGDRAADESLPVFVIDQHKQDGTFDESKVVLGEPDEKSAREAYLSNYPKGWNGLGAIRQMTMPEFKAWVQDPAKTKQPAASARRAPPDVRVEALPDQAKTAAEQTTETPPNGGVSGSGIGDLGEKIGGARKDLSTKTGSRKAKAVTSESNEPAWRRRYGITESVRNPGQFQVVQAKKGPFGNRPASRQVFASEAEAEAAIPLIEVSRNHRAVPRGDDWAIARDVTDRKRVFLKDGFDSREAAMKYMAEHAVELIETTTTLGEESLPRPEKVFRIGDDRRSDDVTGKDFMDAFGFRGVEFGNWNSQDERQEVMNHAYDGLMDLADLLNVPPKALSLNGDLSLAFGARGHGLSGARAHYEPGYAVINLTKMKGAGSLAHEWLHALDHYLARQNKQSSSERKANERGDMVFATKGNTEYLSAGQRGQQARPELLAAFNGLIDTMVQKAENYVEDTARAEKFLKARRDSLQKQLGEVRDHIAKERSWGRKKRAAGPQELAEFDTLADRILNGEAFELEYRANEKSRSRYAAPRETNDTFDALSALLKKITGRGGFSADRRDKLDYVRSAMKAYKQRIDAWESAKTGEGKTRKVATQYVLEAKKLDQTRRSDYWTLPTELLARAFSSYVEDKLKAMGKASAFMSFGSDERFVLPAGIEFARPFPVGEERAALNKAFDHFFEVVKTEETDDGNVRLFSTPEPTSGPVLAPKADELRAAVRQVMDSWKGDKPFVQVVQSSKELPDAARDADGKWRTAEGWFDGRRQVYIVAGNNRSQARALQVLAHEALGHFGVERVLGAEQWKQLVADAKRLRGRSKDQVSPSIWKALQSAERRYGDANDVTFAKELLAIMAEQNVRTSMTKRILAAIRQFLRKIGIPANFTRGFRESELLAALHAGRQQVQRAPRGANEAPAAGTAGAFSRPGIDWNRRIKVSAVQSGKFGQTTPAKDADQARRRAFAWLEGMRSRGATITNTESGLKFGFSGRGNKELRAWTADPSRIDLLAALPQATKHGVLADVVTTGDTSNTRQRWATLYAPVRIGGDLRIARIVARDAGGGMFLYDLEQSAILESTNPAEAGSERGRSPATKAGPVSTGMTVAEIRDVVNADPRNEWQLFSRDPAVRDAFFKDSKVRDDDGNLQPMYHGTAEDFFEFDADRGGEATGHASATLGNFFTGNRTLAEGYAANAADGVPAFERVIEVNLNVTNPYSMTLEEMQAIESQDEARAIRQWLARQGYDGIHVGEADNWITFRSNQSKNLDNANPTDSPDIRFSMPDPEAADTVPSMRSQGIPREAGEPVSRYRNNQPLKAHPSYAAAKAGDVAAAVELVRDLGAPLAEQAQAFGADVIYVAPHAEEASGRNSIPVTLAQYLATTNGAGIVTDIVQSNRAFHTGADMMERLIARSMFDGPVQSGARYVLVDDVTTGGGTLADLAGYIQANGGEVAGTVVFTNSARDGGKLQPTPALLHQLERRFGNEIRELFQIDPAALTASEAGYLIGFRTADELRNRVTKAERERDGRLRAKGIRLDSDTESGVTQPETNDSPAPPSAGPGRSGGSTDGDEPLFSRNSIEPGAAGAGGLSVQQAEKAIAGLRASFAAGLDRNGVEIRVVPDQSAFGEAADGYTAKGAYYPASRRVVLAAASLRDVSDARTTLRHELVAHFGLNLFTPEVKQSILDRLLATRGKDKAKVWRDLWAKIEKDYGSQDANVQAEELFALIAQDTPDGVRGWWSDFLTKIMKALRRAGFLTGPVRMPELQSLARSIAQGIRDGKALRTFPANDQAQFSAEADDRKATADGVAAESTSDEAPDSDELPLPPPAGQPAPDADKKNPIADALDNLELDHRTLKDAIQGALSGGVTWFKKKFGLGLMPMNYLADFTPAWIRPHVDKFMRIKREMDSYRGEKHAGQNEVSQDWLKYAAHNRRESEELAKLMHETTLALVDPTDDKYKPLAMLYGGTWHDMTAEGGTALIKAIKANIRQAPNDHRQQQMYRQIKEIEGRMLAEQKRPAAHQRLRARFMKLSPEAQKLYRQVRDHYKKEIAEWDEITLANIDKAMDQAVAAANRDYKNILRKATDEGKTGDDLATLKARAANRLEDRLAKLAEDRRVQYKELKEKFESERVAGPYFPVTRFGEYFVAIRDKAGKLLSWSQFESKAKRDWYVRQVREKLPGGSALKIKIGVMSNKDEVQGAVDAGFITDVQNMLSEANVGHDVKDAVWQRYLETLPDFSQRKAFLHRSGVHGWQADALRAFGSRMFHMAHQMAKLKYGTDLSATLDSMSDDIKDSTDNDTTDADIMLNEMRKRLDWVMNPTGGTGAQKVSSFAFVWNLAVTPAAALVNWTQTPMMGIPVLGSRLGGSGKAAVELLRASSQLARSKHLHVENSLNGHEKAAMMEFYRAGLLDRTHSHALAGVGDQGVNYSATREKWMGRMSFLFHHVERINRETTALAAYRLARKQGQNHEKAVDTAMELTWRTHFDYSNSSRPLHLTSDTAKILMVHRTHSLNMTVLLFQNLRNMMKGESPESKAIARKEFAGILGMHALLAGAMGVPFYGIAMVAAGMFKDVFGDDDDERTPEDLLKKAMYDALPKWAADTVLYGAPSTASRLSIYNRIGLPDLFFRSPDRELEGRAEADFWMAQTLGPAIAIAPQIWSGMDQIRQGEFTRGIEKMTPKAIRDVIKTGRYWNEGVLTMRDDPIIDSLNAWELIGQASGFSPFAVSEAYDQRSAKTNLQARIQSRRSQAMNLYALGATRNDRDLMHDGLEAIKAFNRAYPEKAITRQGLRQSLQRRARNHQRAEMGMLLDQKLKPRIERALGF